MRKKTLIGVLAVVGAASVAAGVFAPAPALVTATPQPHAQLAHTASNPILVSLPVRQAIGPRQGDLFVSPEPPKPAPVAVAPPPAALPLPPMPYRIAGRLIDDGNASVVLAKGDRVFTVQRGDILDNSYRVEGIDADRVTLVYIPLGAEQHLRLNFALAPQASQPSARAQSRALKEVIPSGPAQLRWLGPDRVFAGSPFEVVLKLTSAQPVRSSPVELSFDAKLLEPVAVRGGEFFAGGKFSYRVAPGGSIFIGASGAGTAAEDLDFLILTFRPIRPAGSAELKLSPFMLEGPDGGTVAHQSPAAFRTAILQ